MSKVLNTDSGHRMIVCPGCDMLHAPDQRWSYNGNADSPTFHQSLLVHAPMEGGEMRCHSFIRDGRIQFLNDCTHALAGQTVELPDIDQWLAADATEARHD